MANAALTPSTMAAVSLHQWQHGFAGSGEVDINQLTAGLTEHVDDVCNGNLDGVKARLLMQASVLDGIFHKLHMDAAKKIATAGSLELIERLLRLALRAQSNSRATMETLVLLEHPKALFIQQQNNAAGHQQVVNARARKAKSGPNKLLGDTNDERLDTSATSAPVCGDPAMATLDSFDRAKNGGGQGNRCAQRVSRGRH